jgi:hypothetical protein
MTEQHLDAAVAAPEHEQAGTLFWRHALRTIYDEQPISVA